MSHWSSSAGGSGQWDNEAMRHLRNSCAVAARAAAFLRPGAVRGEIHRPLQHIARVLLEMAIAGHGQHVGVPPVRPDQLGALRVAAFEMHSVPLAFPRDRFLLVHEVLRREAAGAHWPGTLSVAPLPEFDLANLVQGLLNARLELLGHGAARAWAFGLGCVSRHCCAPPARQSLRVARARSNARSSRIGSGSTLASLYGD